MKKIARTFLEFLIYVAIVGGIVWGVPTFLSWKLHTKTPIAAITSGSMWPLLTRGDLVFIESVPQADLKVGDIVVWKNPNGFTIHRIVTLGADTITTKGDANFTADNPVAYSDVIGKDITYGNGDPIKIPYLGFVSIWGAEIRGNGTMASAGEAQ